jgi:NAD(P)-dependent dehydrogenase (short-subunit alcohol dehydrogenase family)
MKTQQKCCAREAHSTHRCGAGSQHPMPRPSSSHRLVALAQHLRSTAPDPTAETDLSNFDGVPLEGQVAVVTGASRGIGKGVALALAKAGATVYVTGRTTTASDSRPGTLVGTAEEINSDDEVTLGSCIPVVCDHADDASVEALFQRIEQERGRLDILVNNAYDGGGGGAGKWWEQPFSSFDRPAMVGLRSAYITSMLAARMMTPKKAGLIVNISAFGGVKPYTSVVYTTVKTGIDRFTADAALELYEDNVSMVSLWPGLVKTENGALLSQSMRCMLSRAEPPHCLLQWSAGWESASRRVSTRKAPSSLAAGWWRWRKTPTRYTQSVGRLSWLGNWQRSAHIDCTWLILQCSIYYWSCCCISCLWLHSVCTISVISFAMTLGSDR